MTRVRARRARWLRVAVRPDEARAKLDETEMGIDAGDLTPEHVVWLVEHVLLARSEDERRDWLVRLEQTSARTGVQPPPWERRLVIAAQGG